MIENIIATKNVSIGLEAGSKPELLAVLALAPKGGTIVCNGYKDREFIRLALMGQKLGHNVFIVIEKESEVDLVIEEAASLKVKPQVGLRVRLSSLASSKWADTGGEKSKFGLSAAQLLSVVEGAGDRSGPGHPPAALPYGLADRQPGGLPARFQGSDPLFTANCATSACRLTISTWAAAWVWITTVPTRATPVRSTTTWTITPVWLSVCSKSSAMRKSLPHPHIFSESGRSLTAHHAMPVVQVTDVEKHNDDVPVIENKESLPETVQWLVDLLGPTDIEMVTETYWRATHYMSDIAAQYADGKIPWRKRPWPSSATSRCAVACTTR